MDYQTLAHPCTGTVANDTVRLKNLHKIATKLHCNSALNKPIVTFIDKAEYQMTHAKSLRVIGQSLENAKLQAFELTTDGPNYVAQSDSLDAASEWILRQALSPVSERSARHSTSSQSIRFTPVDISRLDDQAEKQRKINPSPNTQVYRRLSQLLRALGDHLDRTQVNAFHISWTPSSVYVDFQLLDGQSDSRTFTAEKLEQLGSHSRFRRSSRVHTSLPDSLKPPTSRNR